jgi:hypothetical protein
VFILSNTLLICSGPLHTLLLDALKRRIIRVKK